MSTKKLVRFLVKSFGIKRRLAAALQTVALVATANPHLAGVAAIVSTVASYLGIAGIAHATAQKTLGKSPLSSIAAFFAALVLASSQVPALAPYHELFLKVAQLFSVLSVGSTFKKQ